MLSKSGAGEASRDKHRAVFMITAAALRTIVSLTAGMYTHYKHDIHYSNAYKLLSSA